LKWVRKFTPTEAGDYWRMDSEYAHEIINHPEEYVRGNVHTNGMEKFWSLLKRSISGSYVTVEPFHLFRYVDEQAFRYNDRKDMNDSDRFDLAVRHCRQAADMGRCHRQGDGSPSAN
jgi:hypothetical protein